MQDVRSRVEQSLESLRAGLAGDGADLSVTGWPSAGEVEISLVLQPDACADCIVSTDMLHTMIDGVVRQAAPEIDQIRVSDPRASQADSSTS